MMLFAVTGRLRNGIGTAATGKSMDLNRSISPVGSGKMSMASLGLVVRWTMLSTARSMLSDSPSRTISKVLVAGIIYIHNLFHECVPVISDALSRHNADAALI